MGTKWYETANDDLPALLDRLLEEHDKDTVSVLEASAIVKDQGAFVEISSKDIAKDLFLPDTVVLYSRRAVSSYEQCIGEEFSHACFVAGESKTADIEQVLVSGVHGPKECIFVVVQ